MDPILFVPFQDFLYLKQNLARAITVANTGVVKVNSTYTGIHSHPRQMPNKDFLIHFHSMIPRRT